MNKVIFRATLAIVLLVAGVAFAAVTVSVNGSNHTIPQTNEKGWGANVTAWIQAISSYSLQRNGGSFTLTADTDFGASYGLKSIYLKSRATNPSSAGVLRLGNTESIGWRNAGNAADLLLTTNSSNQLTYNGIVLSGTNGVAMDDSTSYFFDNSDTTKKMQFQLSGITSGTTRTFTAPDASTTLVGTDTTQTLTGKTISGNTATYFTNSGSVYLPTSGTLATLAGTESLYNKTFDSTSTIPAASVSSGTLAWARLGSLDASIIGAGTFATARLGVYTGAVAASQVSSGTLNTAQIGTYIGSVAASQVDSGTLATARIGTYIGSVAASQVDSGTLAVARIPAFTAISPSNTKGIVITSDGTTNVALTVGSDAQVLTADSTQSKGVKWATPSGAPDQSYELSNVGIATSVSGSALTIALKVKDGSTNCSAGDTCKIGFRSATLTNGSYVQRTVTGALSVVVSSGSTLGCTSAKQCAIWVYAIDNAGTVELAVSQQRLYENNLITTTAEGGAGAADSGEIAYSTTARTSVSMRTIAKILITEATAGTWASNSTQIDLNPFAETETVAARYTSATSNTINNGVTSTIDFSTKDFDSHNAVAIGVGAWSGAGGGNATTNWKFTAPISGTYRVNAKVMLTTGGGWAAAESHALTLYKNNSLYTNMAWAQEQATHSNYVGDNGSTTIRLLAGDYIDVRYSQSSGGNINMHNDGQQNHVSIERIGNY